MSVSLLQALWAHISPVVPGYSVRYFRWTDLDLSGSGNVFLIRMNGTAGESDEVAQLPDISLQLITTADATVAGSNAMDSVMSFLRSEAGYTSEDVAGFIPVGPVVGPNYLANDRARFELVVRCLTEDH